MNNAFEGKADANYIYEVYEERKAKTSSVNQAETETTFKVKKIGTKPKEKN